MHNDVSGDGFQSLNFCVYLVVLCHQEELLFLLCWMVEAGNSLMPNYWCQNPRLLVEAGVGLGGYYQFGGDCSGSGVIGWETF